VRGWRWEFNRNKPGKDSLRLTDGFHVFKIQAKGRFDATLGQGQDPASRFINPCSTPMQDELYDADIPKMSYFSR
jgi:hypothetical protein